MAKKSVAKKRVKHNPKWILLVARVLIGLLFIISGWEKLTNISETVKFMASTGMPLATSWMAGLAGAVELLGGIALLVGLRARLAGGFLAGFMAVVTYFIHLAPAWKMAAGMAKSTEMLHVWLNLALVGGLLLLSVAGAGRISLDKK